MAVKLTIHPPNEAEPRVVEFTEARVTLGRSSGCDIRLPFRIVSSHHLTFVNDSPAGLSVRDEGSTNGTLLDGSPLGSGEQAPLSSGSHLQIVDLKIGVDVVPSLGAGFGLDQTSTLARQMVGEALLDSSPQDSDTAYFDICSGRRAGERVDVPDDLESGRIGPDREALVHLPSASGAVEVLRRGDGFAVRRLDTPDSSHHVLINDAALDETSELRSGDRLEIGEVELAFVDPLEAYLAELDGVAPKEDQAGDEASADAVRTTLDSAQNPSPSAPAGQTGQSKAPTATAAGASEESKERAWGAFELGLLGVSLLLTLGVLYLLLSIFELV